LTKIIKIDVALPVKVRAHEVEINPLQELLRGAKKKIGFSNAAIAAQLNLPITWVEHWFRTDKCFSIPDPENWNKLKELLGIETDYFDKQVTEFLEKPNEYEQANRIYFTGGIAPTITATGDVLIIEKEGEGVSEIKEVEQLEANGFKVNDFFCGAGGMGLGFKNAGFEITGAWDFDKYAVQSYRHNVGDHVKEMSVLDMTPEDVPASDVWTFGAPCQAFSIAGKQLGMDFKCTNCGNVEQMEGEDIIDRNTICSKCGSKSEPKDIRGILFFEIMRLLKYRTREKPPIILLENVKGLKKFLPVIRYEYEKRGYKMYYALFNSKFWGVPQNRERYFVVGVRNDISAAFDFPEQQEEFIPKLSSVLETNVDEKFYLPDEKAKVIIEQAVEGLKVKQATKKGYDIATEGDSINISHPNSTTRRGRVGKQVAQTLLTGQEQVVVEKNDLNGTVVDGKNSFGTPKVFDNDLHPTILGTHYKEPTKLICYPTVKEGVSPCLQTKNRTHPKELKNKDGMVVIEKQPGKTIEVSYNRKDGIEKEIDISPTLSASDWRGLNQNQSKAAVAEFEPVFRVRKLTPREYARLQGFPDSFEQVVSDSQFYKQMGNAVTVNVAYAIAKEIAAFLESEKPKESNWLNRTYL
jgi:DNA (cytosine-5)-methyltransferase 1